MHTVKPKFETGEQAIEYVGKILFKNFTLSDPLVKSIYEKVYWCLAGENAFFPFSRNNVNSPGELGIDSTKGILLVGNTGVGMTTLFRIMQKLFLNTARELRIISTGNLAEYLSKRSGVNEVLNEYGRHLWKDLLIDDIDLSLHRDYRITTIKDLIYQREALYAQTQGQYKTHLGFSFTINSHNPQLSIKQQLIEVYGEHVYGRMVSMCNIILWQGKSFRLADQQIVIL